MNAKPPTKFSKLSAFMPEIQIEIVYPLDKNEYNCSCLCHERDIFEDELYSEYLLSKKTFNESKPHKKETIEDFDYSSRSSLYNLKFYRGVHPKITTNYTASFRGFMIWGKLINDSLTLNGSKIDRLRNSEIKLINNNEMWKKDEDLRIIYLKSALNLTWDEEKLFFINRSESCISKRWITCLRPSLSISKWNKRQIWFLYLIQRNLGKNFKEMERVFLFRGKSQIHYAWERLTKHKCSDFERGINLLFISNNLQLLNIFSKLELYLLRKYNKVEEFLFTRIERLRRRRRYKNKISKKLEDVFEPNCPLLADFVTYDTAGEKKIDFNKVGVFILTGNLTLMKRILAYVSFDKFRNVHKKIGDLQKFED